MTHSSYHIPVLPHEAIARLAIRPGGTYVDLTFGGGGHTRLLLEQLAGGQLWAFDQDDDARLEAEKIDDPRFHFIQGNFRFFGRLLRAEGIQQVDGILADLGVSSHQLDQKERGFSTRFEGPLDMRMYPGNPRSAADLLHTLSRKGLTHIFRTYADIKNAEKLAAKIIAGRRIRPVRTTQALLEVIADCGPRIQRYQYSAKVFQALRIAVNDERGALEEMLEQLPGMLASHGRVVIISYHSGEDRLVKRFFQYGNVAGKAEKDFYGNLMRPLEPLHRRVGKASQQEVMRNSRARSARIRDAEKKSDKGTQK